MNKNESIKHYEKSDIDELVKDHQVYEKLSLEFQKGDYAKAIIGYYQINGKIFLATTGFLKGEYWKWGTTLVFSNYVDGTVIETQENSWKNKYTHHYIVNNGKGCYIPDIKEALPLLKQIPFEIEIKILEDGTHEYYFEYNMIMKEYLKSQGARWNPDKKCWYSFSVLKLPDGDIKVKEAI